LIWINDRALKEESFVTSAIERCSIKLIEIAASDKDLDFADKPRNV